MGGASPDALTKVGLHQPEGGAADPEGEILLCSMAVVLHSLMLRGIGSHMTSRPFEVRQYPILWLG